MSDPDMLPLLQRIADALERMVPPARPSADPEHGAAFVWHAEGEWLEAVPVGSRVDLALLQGIDRARDIPLHHTRRFAHGPPAHNARLGGPPGPGQRPHGHG